MLDKFTPLLAVASAYILALAVTHEWAYFWVIGRQFQTLISPADYFSSAVLWLPPLAVLYAGLGTFTALEWRANDFRPPRRRDRQYHIIGILLIVLAIGTFLLGPPETAFYSYGVAFAYIWSFIFSYLIDHQSVRDKLTTTGIVVGVFTPILFSVAFGMGLTSGHRDLTNSPPSHQLKIEKESNPRTVVLLRTLDRGVLVRGFGYDVIFFKWAEVNALTYLASGPVKQSHACQLFGMLCFEVREPSKAKTPPKAKETGKPSETKDSEK